MRWLTDATRGDWLKPLIGSGWAPGSFDMHTVVPRGFEAYARIVHPAVADRPIGDGWPSQGGPGFGEIDTRLARWDEVADACGTIAHPLMQWHRLARQALYSHDEIFTAEGWRFSAPQMGQLEPTVLAHVSAILVGHTETPDAGVAAIWNGWGGLMSEAGHSTLTMTDAADTAARAESSAVQPGTERPGSGMAPAEVAAGRLLELPQREHVLVDAGIREFATESWPHNAPWVRHPEWPESPSLIWPNDHSWVLVTEVDFDSTVVAGSRTLVNEMLEHPLIEAYEISEGADLSSDGDRVNLPR